MAGEEGVVVYRQLKVMVNASFKLTVYHRHLHGYHVYTEISTVFPFGCGKCFIDSTHNYARRLQTISADTASLAHV